MVTTPLTIWSSFTASATSTYPGKRPHLSSDVMDGLLRFDWTQISAVVQAIGAVLIVLLTWRLARTAKDAIAESARQRDVSTKALEAAARQADIAEKALAAAARQAELAEGALAETAKQTEAAMAANVEARRQRHLGSVALLEVSYLGTRSTPSVLASDFTIRNISATPALQVHLAIYGLTSGREPTHSELAHSRVIPVLGPGQDIRVEANMWDVKNFPARPNQPPPPPGTEFSYDWLRVSAECRGILGARIIQRYDWPANYPSLPWELREVEIVPDPEDQGWVQRL